MFPKSHTNKPKISVNFRLLSRCQGIVVLEYAVIAMIGLPMLLLLLDVANVLRVKTSLQESVKRTLRCLTPLEADCLDNTGETPIPLYEVEVQRATNRWPLPEYLYSVNTEGLFGTKHQFDNPIARVLDRVSYDRKEVEYLISEKKERLKVNLDYYLKTATLPYVDTGTYSATTLNPRFLYRKSLASNYPRETLDISNVIGTVRNLTQDGTPFNKLIGSISFTVPAVTQLPCFNSRSLDLVTTNHESNFKQECNLEQVPTVLYITGKFPVDPQAEGSRGRVKLDLRGKGLKINGQVSNFKEFNLGARAFTYDSKSITEANFVPRGAPLANISSINNFQEFKLYQNINLQAGETYTLDFYLQRTNEVATRTGWQGQKLKLFYGQQHRVREEHYCEQKNVLIQGSGANSIKTCQYLEVRNQSFPENYLYNTHIENYSEIRSLGCMGVEEQPLKCVGCTININLNNSCTKTAKVTKPCPSNFGTKLDPNTTSFSEAEKICPVGDPQKVPNTRQVYLERDLMLPNLTLNYEQQSCSDSLTPRAGDFPEAMRNYKKLTWKKGAVSVGKQIDTQGIKPSKFKLDNSKINCSAFQVKNKSYDFNKSTGTSIARSLSSSLLIGAHSELVTGCNWEDSVEDEARDKLKLTEFDFVDVDRELARYNYVNEKPGLSCYGYLPQKNIEVGALNLPEKMGPFTKDQIPSICQDEDINCEIKLVGFQGQGNNDFKWDESLAEKKGYEALKAAYAGAKNNCNRTDPNCFKMDINFDGRKFDVYASMELPLLSLLGKKQIKLNFRNQAVYQGALLFSGK